MVSAAWISAAVLKLFVKSPVEMNPTASRACCKPKHLLEDLDTSSMLTPPDPSGISLGVKLEKSRIAGNDLNATRRYVGPVL